jgi:hypothetical protein
MQRMWNVICFVIPVTNGATGVVIKGLKGFLGTVSGKHLYWRHRT